MHQHRLAEGLDTPVVSGVPGDLLVAVGTADDPPRVLDPIATALADAAAKLQRMIGGGDIVVTRGSEGMFLFQGKSQAIHVPTLPREVFDVQGAGDTAIAALALALRAGGSLHEAAVLANAASGIVVNKVGTATASAEELKAILPEAIAAARGK